MVFSRLFRLFRLADRVVYHALALVAALLLLVQGASVAAHPARPPKGKIALTFDDLPALTIFSDQDYIDYINTMILRGLQRHHFPAIGFVNAGKFDETIRARQINVLKRWLDNDMDLGNHTFSHSSPNELGAKGYIDDIAKGEPVLKQLLAQHGRKLRWFRHPYLETGAPAAVKREINDWLRTHGYRIAPVTIDADDWEFAEPYDNAIARHDEAQRLQIRNEYLAYTEKTIGWYRTAARAVFGRDIAYVILLHDTRLNADCFEDLAALLKKQRLKPVTLDEAMRDPAYKTPDLYVGRDGIDWMERFSDTLKKPLPWDSYRDPPKDISDDYNKIDPSGR